MEKYIFKNNKFDVVICLNGEIPDKEIFDILDGIPIIAADGAFNKLSTLGIHPYAIVGDMDSIVQKHNESNTLFEKISSQETNDFEKCINYIESKGYKSILIIGFTGGLLEHSLNNTSIILKFTDKYDFTIYHQYRYAFLIKKATQFEVSKNEIISIIPYPKVRLTTKNLKWELNDENLELGVREGARNKATDSTIELNVLSGRCFVFIDSRLPLRPERIA